MASSQKNRKVKVAVSQVECGPDLQENLHRCEKIVRESHKAGAKLILLQELFAHRYFGPEQNPQWFALAESVENSQVVRHFQSLALELQVFLPISFFERKQNNFFNSLAMITDQGQVMGVYRKSHLPDGSGYQEKFYFSPGNTGFRVWQTSIGNIGTAICWDQWFPEAARAMALQGADILLYPTAIGNEPQNPNVDSSLAWQRVMQGHAVANTCFVAASNRVGQEKWPNGVSMDFYGKSFLCDFEGNLLEDMDNRPGIAVAELDFAEAEEKRHAWGLFRDRRPDLYTTLLALDGETKQPTLK